MPAEIGPRIAALTQEPDPGNAGVGKSFARNEAPTGDGVPWGTRKGGRVNCSVAIQFLPMDATTDDAMCDAVDAVIAYIDSTGVDYFVGPFETAIEGDYETCMEILKNCQLVGAKAGCRHMMCYAKINYRPDGDVMSTDRKIGKYHPGDPEFAPEAADAAA